MPLGSLSIFPVQVRLLTGKAGLGILVLQEAVCWEICGKPSTVLPSQWLLLHCRLWVLLTFPPVFLMNWSSSRAPSTAPGGLNLSAILAPAPDPSTTLIHRPLTLLAHDPHRLSLSITLHGPSLS